MLLEGMTAELPMFDRQPVKTPQERIGVQSPVAELATLDGVVLSQVDLRGAIAGVRLACVPADYRPGVRAA